MKLSIIIPTYNEERNIQSSLDKAISYLHTKNFDHEIIISDDGSRDNTIRIVESFAKNNPNMKIIKNNHTGKAGAVRNGMLAASGDIVLFTDADFATPIGTIDKILPEFTNGADVVIGSRALGKRDNEPLKRKIAGKAYNILVQLILLPHIDDTQAGFKAFSAKANKKIFTSMVRFSDNQTITTKPNVTGFDLEILYIARRLKYKIVSIPIAWEYKESKRVNVIRDSYKLFIDLLSIKWNAIKRLYPSP